MGDKDDVCNKDHSLSANEGEDEGVDISYDVSYREIQLNDELPSKFNAAVMV